MFRKCGCVDHKFQKSELDRFNDSVKNILENPTCVSIFKLFVKTKRPECFDVFRLWRKAHKASVHHRTVTENMLELMDEIDDFEYSAGITLEEIMNRCCAILERTVHAQFMEELRAKHKA